MTVNPNALFVTLNRSDDGNYTVGSESPSLPIENLQERQLTKVFRTAGVAAPDQSIRDTDPAKTWFEIDLLAVQILDVLALLNHNLTQAGKWRVRLSMVADFSTVVYDTGEIDSWPLVSGFGSLPWGVFNWGDVVQPSEATFYTISSVLVLEQPTSARYIRVDLVNESNPDGFLQAGRFMAGPAYRPSKNIEYGWQIGWKDDSTATKTIGGQTYMESKPRYRVAGFSIANIDETEIYSNVFDFIDRRKGISGEILFIPQPNKPDLFIHEVIYGRMAVLNPITHPDYSGRSRTFEMEELL